MSGLMAGNVMVTGGAAGVGRATAIAFARRGANVVIGDIDGAGAEKTVGNALYGYFAVQIGRHFFSRMTVRSPSSSIR
jgi:NAD(P)-dependent dehydrogenase (short-subunit alcohol dehydrogenase family)